MNTLLENGIIVSASLQEQIEMASKKEILKTHPYQIFYASDGRWATYLPDADKKRRLVKRKSKEDLEDAIVSFYEETKRLSFIEVFHRYREYHDQMVCDSSRLKYDSDEKRYFDGRSFSVMAISTITLDDVEVFIRGVIGDEKLCQSAAKTLYHYVDNTFEFAVRHDYISKSPMRFMNAKGFYKYTYPSKRSKKPKVISEGELKQLSDRYEEDLRKRPDSIPIYAVIFSSLTGMRVGEIAALTWENVFGDYILVDKSQKYNPKTKEYYIHTTKNTKIRKFPLTNDIKALLNRVKEEEERLGYLTEFIFSDASGPLTFRKISSCIKNKCRQLGIETYGIHAYRKTVNSFMALDGVPSSVRASLLGHSKEVNEKYYTYDVSDLDDKTNIISRVNEHIKNRVITE